MSIRRSLTRSFRRPRIGRRPAIALALTALLGIGLGAWATDLVRTATAPHPYADAPVVATVGPDVLGLAPRSGDDGARPASESVAAPTFRVLARVPHGRSTLWAARDRVGEVCLAAVLPGALRFHASCATPATLARDGIVLLWSEGAATAHAASSPSAGYVVRHFAAVWQPDGRIRVTSSAG